ncbi:Phosphonate-transporting ATPase [Syntrophobotulus glycolicus DSM 8271]|uniref:Phosphonate-transporting ATPase n=1 Tax=Syntrophobotulus glycolicus (strain DSM 8271 / FlGlyR) TaxID=645991 RepID=F0SWV6_SYNGF|nr:ABC transporter ATP-binding protein [Syntrophobotulus glycolicus]ADY54646.1 Phosphonate-transporting ATPase [Syntrophobotulus glycolicus DSM 8271]
MIKLRDIEKKYPSPEGGEITALSLSRLDIQAGEEIGLAGASGTGKTTLLNIISGISLPSRGSVRINEVEINLLPEAQRDLFRAQTIGYVFQTFNLIPSLTAKENVLASIVFGKKIPAQAREERCLALLKRVGLSHRINHKPGQLSGGEQQRVSIARALANRPAVVIADEPTANLDMKTRMMVLELLREVCRENTATLIMATHDQEVLKSLKRVIDLEQTKEGAKEDATQDSMA